MLDVRPDDRLLLASDGLTGVVPDKDLSHILGTVDDPQRAALMLKDLALANDSKDNVTCLIIHAVAQEDSVSGVSRGEEAKAKLRAEPVDTRLGRPKQRSFAAVTRATTKGCGWTMLPLDDFIAHVATSGLVAPEGAARVRGQIEPEPASDASVRLARLLIQGSWLTTYQARKLLTGAPGGFSWAGTG